MAKKRLPIWLILIVLFPGLILAFVVGLWAWASATAPTFHPNPDEVRSERDAEPARQWIDAVERGRQSVRASMADQNLPGISVAVGVAPERAAGEIVWAEGFGWSSIGDHSPVTPKTRFRIGSTSEVLTSAAIGALLEQKSSLDRDVFARVHDKLAALGIDLTEVGVNELARITI